MAAHGAWADALAPDIDCNPLHALLAATVGGARAVAGPTYDGMFAAWSARIRLPGFDSCWVDDVTGAFWCRYRPETRAAGNRFAAENADMNEGCWPDAPTGQSIERGDGDSASSRWIQDWRIGGSRRLRLVHRRDMVGPGAVFLYLY